MTKVETKSLPASFGGLAAGFMASQLLLNSTAPLTDSRPNRVTPYIDYASSPSTYGPHASLFTASALTGTAIATSAIDAFYGSLLAQQERLGREFEQVLFDNLWQLYAR
jgi:hypothetical protein